MYVMSKHILCMARSNTKGARTGRQGIFWMIHGNSQGILYMVDFTSRRSIGPPQLVVNSKAVLCSIHPLISHIQWNLSIKNNLNMGHLYTVLQNSGENSAYTKAIQKYCNAGSALCTSISHQVTMETIKYRFFHLRQIL